MSTVKRLLLSISLMATFVVSGCGSGNGQGYRSPALPSSPSMPTSESFTRWSKTNVFPLPEATTPVLVDALALTFDGDENPNAYSDLLPAG